MSNLANVNITSTGGIWAILLGINVALNVVFLAGNYARVHHVEIEKAKQEGR